MSKRNIEIKARIANDAEFERRVETAKKLTNTNGEILSQRDVFYKVCSGRLKLRTENGKAMLIQYARPDVSGPKLSEFDVLAVEDADKLDRMLSNSVGVIGEVKKSRYLFLLDQTRIHLDKVEGLGTFLEFEVCLRPEQTIEDGTQIANDLINKFEIGESDLMTGAYMDELKQK
ncbi:uncharacterized protein LOC116340453 isoform X2 [Contarinia nasturtii]|nr:uncharacterized protein LOC116340453 isoform X2 [Contarinia nasturtii]XP_031622810.1 uncharacterized protein LOC116340453 isoform X2 [Contarinia nasturtii]XP_031622811.1 uncharacterized protein LOC116340453 isoform X2 [Contarinia nasturtii]